MNDAISTLWREHVAAIAGVPVSTLAAELEAWGAPGRTDTEPPQPAPAKACPMSDEEDWPDAGNDD